MLDQLTEALNREFLLKGLSPQILAKFSKFHKRLFHNLFLTFSSR